MGHFHLWGLIKPSIWTYVITCKLGIAETLHSNKEWLASASPSSIEKGQWIRCKPASGLQMAPARRFNMPHATIVCFIHRLQGIGAIWNHPRSGLPPGSTPSKDRHIRLKIQEVWDDIPRPRIIRLSPFMSRICRVVHEAHGMSQPLLT